MKTRECKPELLDLAKRSVQSRLDELKASIAEIQISANEETKSVAGDKYETGRAMAHLEIEKLQSQQVELNRSLEILRQIDATQIHDIIQLGSVVESSQGNFFLTSSLGELTLNDRRFICISLAAPLAVALKGKRQRDRVLINAREFVIENVF
jgi:hypothetical protein